MILPPSPSSMSILKRGSSRLWGRMCDIDVEGAKSKKGNASFETNLEEKQNPLSEISQHDDRRNMH